MRRALQQISMHLLALGLALGLTQGASVGRERLFECLSMGRTAPHCCCAAAREALPACGSIERPTCCITHDGEAPSATALGPELSLPAVTLNYTRLASVFPRSAYRSNTSQPAFTLHEAPRAVGPPILLRTQNLRI